MSFYTYDQAINDKDNMLIMYLLEFLANQFNETFVYGEIEFDEFCNMMKKLSTNGIE